MAVRVLESNDYDIIAELEKLDSSKDSEMTLAEYATEEYLDNEIDIQRELDIATAMDRDPNEINVYTSDSVEDIEWFDGLFNQLSDLNLPSKSVNDMAISKIGGKSIAYAFINGLEIIYY